MMKHGLQGEVTGTKGLGNEMQGETWLQRRLAGEKNIAVHGEAGRGLLLILRSLCTFLFLLNMHNDVVRYAALGYNVIPHVS